MVGSDTNAAAYTNIYNSNPAGAVQQIGQIYGNGEITSVDGQTYNQYYGAICSKKIGN